MSQCPDSPPVVLYVSAKNGLPAEEVTWAKMLKTYGYRTAAVGKSATCMGVPKWVQGRCLLPPPQSHSNFMIFGGG